MKIVAAEPMQEGEPVQGLRSLDDGFIPPIIDLSVLDRKIFVTNRDAILWTRKLLQEEGIFAGVSSGAIARVASRIAGELDEGNVVFIVAATAGSTSPVASTRGRSRISRTSTPPFGGRAGPRAQMVMEADLVAEIVAHAQEDSPNECCGVVAVQPGDPATP